MSDLHRQGIFQQRHAQPKGGEDLEVLGKQASECWYGSRETGCGPSTIGEAVVEVVKKAGLSPEQVRRVVEFANTHSFLREFHKLSSGHKYVDFGEGVLASVPDVLRDLNDGGGGTVFDPGTGDYNDPPEEKLSYAKEEHFEKLFGTIAHDDIPFEEPLKPFWDVRDKLAGMHAHVSSDLNSAESLYDEVCVHLEHLTKCAALEGTSLGQIVQAWSAVTDNPVFIKAAFEKITPGLVRDQVFPSFDAVGASLQKTANARIANLEHPLVQVFQDYCGTLTDVAELRYQQEGLGIKLAQFEGALKVGNAAGLRQMVGSGLKAVGQAGEGAGQFVGELSGRPALGKLTEYGIKASPIAAGAVGTKILADEVGASSPVQAAIPHLPGTMAYDARMAQKRHANNPQVRAAMRGQYGG